MLSSDLGGGSFCWLSATPEDGALVLRLHETRDDGGPDYLDVYEFEAVDPDDEFGAGVVVASGPSASELMAVAANSRVRADRWVMAGAIQDEYADLIRTR
jgi:hypothetical protein